MPINQLEEIFQLVKEQVETNQRNWEAYNSAHEAFGVLLEEVDELKAHVWTKQKNRDLDAMRRECFDVAAVAIRFAFDICNEERGRK